MTPETRAPSPVDTLVAATRGEGRNALDELAGKKVLACFGITVPKSVVVSPGACLSEALGALEPPFVVKVVSPDILHKSDAGGVALNLPAIEDVQRAIDAMAMRPHVASARITGYLVEEMAPPGIELVIGGVRDPYFGPMIMVGLGGIFVEVLGDVAFRICPITQLDAEEMISDLKGSALLRGARGKEPVSQHAIVEALLKIGGEHGLLVRHEADFKEVDINPLIVSRHAAVAVDARFILA